MNRIRMGLCDGCPTVTKLQSELLHYETAAEVVKEWEDSKLKQIQQLQAEIKEYKKALPQGMNFGSPFNEVALKMTEKDKEIKQLEKLLNDALPHIDCRNHEQNNLITEIGQALARKDKLNEKTIKFREEIEQLQAEIKELSEEIGRLKEIRIKHI
jgi:chromosome segregation ATPase